MANIKITDLTAYTDPLNTDVLPIVDVTSDTTKKVSIADLLKNASAGTAAAPGIAFDGDNTGIYSPGADQLAISTNGTGRLFVDAAGRIGVGNLSPGNQAGEADNLVVGGGSGDTGISILSGTSSEGGLYFADGGGGSAYRGKVIYDHATDSLQLDTAGSERLRITSDGKLGLGTSAPTHELEVAGRIAVAGTESAFQNSSIPTIYRSGSSAGTYPFNGFGHLVIQPRCDSDNRDIVFATGTSGANKVVIDSSGRLGVGTTSPSQLLHLKGSTPVIFLEPATNTESAYLSFVNTSGITRGFVGYNFNDDALIIRSALAERFRITSTGTLMHLGAGNSTTPAVQFNGSAPSNSLVIDSTGKVGLGTSSPTNDRLHIRESVAAGISLEASGTGGSTWRIVSTDDNASLGGGYLGVNNGGYRFVINSAGNVGIGTTSPDGLLTLNATPSNTPRLRFQNQSVDADAAISTYADTNGTNLLIGSNAYVNSAGAVSKFDAGEESAHIHLTRTGTIQFYAGNTTTESARITSDGKLGLGTSNPQNLFSLGLPTATTSRILGQYGNNEAPTLEVGVGQSSTFRGGMRIAVSDTGAGSVGDSVVSFHTTKDGGGTVQRLTIDQDGKVGIGDTGPDFKLDVNGDIGIREDNNLVFHDGSGTPAFRIRGTSGNVLIFERASSNEEQMRIDDGKLLVGTSSARANMFNSTLSSVFQVEGTTHDTSSVSIVRNSNNSSTAAFVLGKSRSTAAGGSTLVNDGDTIAYLTFQGADGAQLVECASIAAYIDGTPGANDMPGRLVFSTTADGASSPTERMRISANGKVSIGRGTTNLASFTTGAYLKLSTGADTTTGDFSCESYAGNAGTRYHFGFSNTNGLVGSITTNSSATAYNTSSDYRLKENVVPLTGAADRVNQLQVHRFNFIADPDETVDGFLAHEAQAVVPECVTGTKDAVDDEGNPVYQGIDQSKMVPLLTAALQEALAKIETLEQRLSDAGIA